MCSHARPTSFAAIGALGMISHLEEQKWTVYIEGTHCFDHPMFVACGWARVEVVSLEPWNGHLRTGSRPWVLRLGSAVALHWIYRRGRCVVEVVR